MHYLAVCAIYRNEGAYLREWIEFHRLVGVEKFFLYDNRSTDDHADLLAPYVAEGTVDVTAWPEEPGQITAYAHCLETNRDRARWIAFIDLDEYLFSPLIKPLPEILPEFEPYPAVVASWCMFGTSGHETKPPGLTIENFDHRKDYPPDSIEQVKSIVDPARTSHAMSGHRFAYREGEAVNENHEVKEGRAPRVVSFERLRVNHYAHRSRWEYMQKLARPQVVGTFKNFPPGTLERRIARANAVRDETVKAYVPELRERLEAIEQRDRGRAKAS